MSDITTRAGKGSPLTNDELDDNFVNLNNDKLESDDLIASDTSFDNTHSGLTATNVQAAVDELQDKKLNIADLAANVVLYPTDAASDISTYYKMVDSTDHADYDTTAVDISTGSITADDQFIAALASEAGVLEGSTGSINLHTIGNVKRTAGSQDGTFYFKVFHRNSSGTETEIGTSSTTVAVSNTTYEQFFADCLIDDTVFAATDRIVVKYYGNTAATGSASTYSFQFGGTQPVRTNLPVPVTVIPHVNDADEISVDTSGFSGNLSGSDDNVQTALETLDALAVSGSIEDLSDVASMNPTDGQLLTWDNTNSQWNAEDAPVSLPDQTGNSGSFLTTNGTTASWTTIAEDQTVTLTGGTNVTVTGTYPNFTISSTDTNTQLTNEQVQDIVGAMFTGNTESGISVTYQDDDGTIDLNVNDPTITLTGDVTGSATMTNLGNVSITATVANDSHTHDTRYVKKAGDTMTGNLEISKTSPILTLTDTNNETGSYPRIDFETLNNQGVSIEHNEFDGELPIGGYGLVVGPSTDNTQFPSTGTLSFNILGDIYAGATSLGSLNKVWHAGNDGSGSGLDADLLDGQHGSYYLNWNNITNPPTIPSPPNDATITISAGTGLSGGGNFTTDQASNETITLSHADTSTLSGVYGSTANGTKIDTITVDANGHITAIATGATGDIDGVTAGSGLSGGGTSGTVTLSHADTSSQASVDNSAGNIIQDVTLDTYGHVTGLASLDGDGRWALKNGSTANEFSVRTINFANIEKSNIGTDGELGFDSSQGLLIYRTQQGMTGTTTVLDGANVDAGSGITISNLGAGGTGTEPFTFSHADTSSQSSVNNSNGTVIQDVSVDGFGHVTSLGSVNLDNRYSQTSHNHDDRYFTESEMRTYFNRGYIDSHQASNLAAGWYTIASNTGDRALGEFQIWDTASSDHQSVLFNASHHFGNDNSNDITVLANSRYSGTNFRYIRIKDGGTYDGAALQVYVDSASNNVSVAITGANAQSSGWVLQDWVADATAPSNVSNWSSFGERCRVDLDKTVNGGIMTTGTIYASSDQRVFADNYHPNADKWTTARTLSLTGDVTGSVSWDGSANASITTTVGNDSHNHSSSSGDFTVGGDLYVAGGQVHVNSGDYRTKYSMWGNNDTNYGIGMGSSYTFGGLNDYAMTFQMNDDTDRGFWWGDAAHTNAQGAMSLTTNGHLAVANSVKIGYGESNTSAAAYDLDVSGNGHITGSLHVGSYIYHDGDTNTYIRFVAADDFQIVVGGRQIIRCDEGTDPDKIQFYNSSNYLNTSGNMEIVGSYTAGGSFIANSDERLKSDIETITDALDKVKSLRGTSYVKNDRAEIGVIAQEVESIIPEVVHTADDEMGTKSVAYGNLVGLLIEAVKELSDKVEALESKES